MLVARAAGLLVVIVLAVLGSAYLATRDRRYLGWSWRAVQVALAFAGAFLALYIAERLFLVI